jgi:4-hydroxy-tetrahydrodipicolinate reductase
MLLKAVDPDDSFDHVYGREGVPGARGHEIGIHALRGGTVAGEHSVFFFGQDESLEFRHTAASRRIFAAGALRAARFVRQKPAGLYNMDDVLDN